MATSPTTVVAETDGGTDRVPHWLDDHLVGEVTDLPRGRKGLWGALALSSGPVAAGLPVTDTSTLGCVAGTMFDIDPTMSIDLTAA